MVSEIRILIVDDELPIRYALQKTLAREGYHVTAVDSGEAALVEIERQVYALALVDLKLKGMDGTAVLAELRRRSPTTVVILLTAHASLETAVQALRQGAHDYLCKPCTTVELRESVRAGLQKRAQELERLELLARQQPAAEPPPSPTPIPPQEERHFLRHGGLIIDPIRHLVTLNGHRLDLSPTEFDLLAYLVSEAPRVISAQELTREVQGYESDSWEAGEAIRSHIYHIRQKARSATGAALVHTVRGIGYTLGD